MLIEEKEEIQLSLFEENLPNKPYCTDDKGWLTIRPKTIAKLKKYVQHNEPTKVRWLVYDCDYWGALEHVGQNHLPPPNIVVTNRANGHSHLFYGLAVPVCISDNGRWHPKDYLRKVSFVLGDALLADQGYRGFISKNPLQKDFWDVSEIRATPWELGEFLEYLEIPKLLPKVHKVVGIGRNVTLFETARKWAYKAVLGYRISGCRASFSEAVLNHCEELNQEFPNPLHFSEVKGIAKSIAKWTWEKYTKSWSDAQFSRIQAKRAEQGKGVSRYRHTEEDRSKAVLMVSEGATQADVAKAFGVSQKTVSKWCASATKV